MSTENNNLIAEIATNPEKELTIREFAELRSIRRPSALRLIERSGVPTFPKKVFDKSGKRSFYAKAFKYQDYANWYLQHQKEDTTSKIIEKSNKLAENNDDLIIGEAFKQKLQSAETSKVIQSAMTLMQIALERVVKENAELRMKCDEDEEWFTVRRVMNINREKNKERRREKRRELLFLRKRSVLSLSDRHKQDLIYSPARLRQKSIEKGYEVKAIPDLKSETGKVYAYHINVWKELYPDEEY